jgi:hypothetical protein
MMDWRWPERQTIFSRLSVLGVLALKEKDFTTVDTEDHGEDFWLLNASSGFFQRQDAKSAKVRKGKK